MALASFIGWDEKAKLYAHNLQVLGYSLEYIYLPEDKTLPKTSDQIYGEPILSPDLTDCQVIEEAPVDYPLDILYIAGTVKLSMEDILNIPAKRYLFEVVQKPIKTIKTVEIAQELAYHEAFRGFPDESNLQILDIKYLTSWYANPLQVVCQQFFNAVGVLPDSVLPTTMDADYLSASFRLDNKTLISFSAMREDKHYKANGGFYINGTQICSSDELVQKVITEGGVIPHPNLTSIK